MRKKIRLQNAPKIARVYIRVSYVGDRGKGPGKGEFISHDMQLLEAQKYVDIFLKGYTLDTEASIRHADIDKSATRMVWRKRQGLVEHLEAAQRGEFDAFIVFKLSRLARNVKEGIEIFDLFEEAGCSMHCVKEQIDTSTPLGRLARTIMFGVSEMEAENISEFARATARTRAEKGLLHGSPPFWISKDENGKYVTNERAADIRRLVELKLHGISYIKTARTLNSEGIRTSEGRRWTTVSVRKYLRPHGLSLLQGHYVFGPDKDDDDPGRIVIPNAYPAVITEDEAEILMAAHRELQEMYGGNPGKAANTTYILSGKLRCASCGGPMTSDNSYRKGKPPKLNYKCRFASESNLPHLNGVSVSASMLEDAVMRVVLLALLDYKQQYESAPPPNAESKNNGTAIQRQIEKLSKQINRLMDDYYTNDLLKAEDFKPRYDSLVEERDRLHNIQQESDSSSTVRLAVKEALKDTDSPKLDFENARRLVLAIVEKVDVPVNVDPKRAGLPKAKRCRAVWVTLKMPLSDGTRRVLAPMYDARFLGERLILDRE